MKWLNISPFRSRAVMVCSCSSALGFVPSGQAFPAAPCKAGRQPSPGWMTVTCLISSAVANSLITAAALKPSPCCQPLPELHQVHQVQPAGTQLVRGFFCDQLRACSGSRLPGFPAHLLFRGTARLFPAACNASFLVQLHLIVSSGSTSPR